jgi:hypothetical protein
MVRTTTGAPARTGGKQGGRRENSESAQHIDPLLLQ